MIVRYIKAFLATVQASEGIVEPFPSVLDVGCGTGLSTIALQEIAQNITGIDISAEMIALAPRENNLQYFVASAEELPFEENKFDLITLSQVFHWLDRNRFFVEANRVLHANGWLIAYSNDFLGQMVSSLEFYRWFKTEYLVKYPTPPRGMTTFAPENINPYGFHFIKEEQYENAIRFSLERLVDYLVTQSNVIAIVEGGRETIEETKTWLVEAIKPMFSSVEEEFLFSASIWYMQCTTEVSGMSEAKQ
ncbi:class I SAM-dependent methyltransferase [Phormidesmis sp. 146-33]